MNYDRKNKAVLYRADISKRDFSVCHLKIVFYFFHELKQRSRSSDVTKESNDEKKIKLAKRLARYYGIFHNIGYITTNPDFPFEEDKYGLHYVYCYLENFVDTAKISITGVIKALADDEQLDPFCKYLMFTHMYIPEQVKEIEHEEIYKRGKKFKEDELPGVRIL